VRTTRFLRRIPDALAALGFAAAMGCGSGETVDPKPDGGNDAGGKIPYETLSEYGFFSGDLKDQRPTANVHRYEVAAALWADHAEKDRFIVLPEGGKIGITDREDWAFPAGSIIIKTFRFLDDLREPEGPSRLIETRLLILEDEGWTSHTYVWDDAQENAVRTVAGKPITVSYVDAAGDPVEQPYNIPNTNQCKGCHARDDEVHLLGVATPQMNRSVGGKNQLSALADLFTKAPNPNDLEAFEDPFGNGPLEQRARAYLAANCGHCHRPGGGGGDSGLVLLAWETDPSKYGVCKSPAAAGAGTGGHEHDIEPGRPEDSIIPFRMASTDPDIKMPELPNLLPDERGIDLVSEWIASMPPVCP
jgi:uncharacterized repeat protein (TIGR03806 family)